MANAGYLVGFVGLDEISLELAASLLHSGYSVQAFEASSKLMDDFSKLGGKRCANVIETKRGANALVTLVSHVDQINGLFHGDEGVLKGLPKDVIIILHSTILPVHIEKLEKSLTDDYHMEIVVDMYASKAVSEVSNGKVMIISSGRSESTSRAEPILSAMGKKTFLI